MKKVARTAHSAKKPVRRAVVDESVSTSKLTRFEAFAKKKGIGISDYLLIRQQHPGMPDGQILHHLLDETTIFVTTDRPFHNKVLSKGLLSYYIGEESISGTFLRGIHIKPDACISKNDRSIKESYLQPKTEIRSLLLPDSPRRLKKLMTKRRRIRNHFGGQDHLDQIAVTVSWKAMGSRTLIGVRIRVSSNVGIKAINASESYVAEVLEPKHRGRASVCYALVLVIQLVLHSVKTIVYYDVAKIDNPVERAADVLGEGYQAFFDALCECFEHLEFVPVSKGKYIEMLRRKLDRLTSGKTNEVMQGDIQEIMQRSVDKDTSIP